MSASPLVNPAALDSETLAVYRGVMRCFDEAKVPFLVGGGFALRNYTGIVRDTKDFDVFILRADVPRALSAASQAGFQTDLKFPHWLGKVYGNGRVVDVIFSSGNGLCPVDAAWFEFGIPDRVLGVAVNLCPAEEMIWQKCFIMERHRYDGADVANIIRRRGETLDWDRLTARFESCWPLLLSHLIQFQFIYPAARLPGVEKTIRQLLLRTLETGPTGHLANTSAPLCRGTLLSLLEYLPAIRDWGHRDARLTPPGNMTPEEVTRWTATFER